MSPTRRPKSRMSILIADREAVFRFGLMKLFGLEDDLRVVAQAENSGQVFSLAKAFRPNLISGAGRDREREGGQPFCPGRPDLTQKQIRRRGDQLLRG